MVIKPIKFTDSQQTTLNLWRSSGGPRGCQAEPHTHMKLKETHELIFSCLSWLAVLLMGAYARRRRWSRSRWRPSNLGLPCTFLMYMTLLWSIDTCQIRLSADQCHMTISRAQVHNLSRSRVLLKLTADQVLVNSNPGLKVNQVIIVSSIDILFCVSVLWLLSSKKKAKQHTENLMLQS